MFDDREQKDLKDITMDYFLMDRIKEVLTDSVSDHVKANLLCDIVKDEVERHIVIAYGKGYDNGFEKGCDDSDKDGLIDTLESIINIAKRAL